MIRRVIVVALLVAGLALLVRGVQSWLDSRAVRTVAAAYLEAVADGNREATLGCLTNEQRAAFEVHARNSEKNGGSVAELFVADTSWTHCAEHVEIDGDHAVVALRIEKDGFRIRPRLHLTRAPGMQWKIVGIEPIAIDPRWEDLKRARAQAEDERTARELSQAFADRPDVRVE